MHTQQRQKAKPELILEVLEYDKNHNHSYFCEYSDHSYPHHLVLMSAPSSGFICKGTEYLHLM